MHIITGHTLSDKRLVNKVLSGNTHAFGIIITNTEKLVAQIVFKMISNAEDRKDIAQDIYVKAYKNLHEFKFQSKLSTWIARISYNTCLDYLRKKKLLLQGDMHEDKDQGDEESDMINTFQGTSPKGVDAYLLQKNLAAILNTAIEKLPPVYRTLITLYHNEEMSYEEITQITGLPAGTVKNYLFRARRTLKDTLLLDYKKEDL